MEVMKNGQIVEQRSISDRPFLRFGRSPTNEVCTVDNLCKRIADSSAAPVGELARSIRGL